MGGKKCSASFFSKFKNTLTTFSVISSFPSFYFFNNLYRRRFHFIIVYYIQKKN